MSPLRLDIIAALGKEVERIEGKRGPWRGGDADRVETLKLFIRNLSGERACLMLIQTEKRPGEIKL